MLQLGSVNQLLQMLDLTRRSRGRGIPIGRAYQDAIRDVASRHHVTYQTIGDLCRRRLGLRDINDFEALVSRWLAGDPAPLRDRIKNHSESAARRLIEEFFQGAHPGAGQPAKPTDDAKPAGLPNSSSSTTYDVHVQEELRLRLPAEISRRLQLALVARIGTTREEAALALIESGFQAERDRIRAVVDAI